MIRLDYVYIIHGFGNLPTGLALRSTENILLRF